MLHTMLSDLLGFLVLVSCPCKLQRGHGHLLTFSAFRMGAYSRWALIPLNMVSPRAYFRNFMVASKNMALIHFYTGTTIKCNISLQQTLWIIFITDLEHLPQIV